MRNRYCLIAASLALNVVVAACAVATSPTPGTATAPTPPAKSAASESSAAPAASVASAVCADADRLRASVTALTSLQLATVEVSGVTAAITEVQSAAEALVVSGHELAGVPVTNLVASIQALQTTVTGLGSQPSLGAKLDAAKAAIDQIKAAASDVESALGTTCPAP
jgi:hypothetical protein